MEAGARRHWTDDDVLADEIELYGELVVAASESERQLTLHQIDRVLGVGRPDAGSCVLGVDQPAARRQSPESTEADGPATRTE